LKGNISLYMGRNKTLVFAGAHPDDETFGMGATLAKYIAAGVKVYYICSTRGEAGTVAPEYLEGYANIEALRCAELDKAAGVLGLAGVYYLGFRDSGMAGSEDNRNPEALINAPIDRVAERLVKIIREIKPDVVITHDANGGYGHPDHIVTHNAVVKAFSASGDPGQFPQAGPAFQPSKLYFWVRSHRLMKVVVKLMPLFGQNPRKFGRNKDVDFTKIIEHDFPINAVVRLTKEAMEIRDKAAACHASQGGGHQPTMGRGLIGLVNTLFIYKNRFFGYYDTFMRAYPPPGKHHRESDLFEGL
jgi:N-acetyl-1-D-myo-inositol-2-amino-2-deoxy-alpha-D-glucopyranoside deacetylase